MNREEIKKISNVINAWDDPQFISYIRTLDIRWEDIDYQELLEHLRKLGAPVEIANVKIDEYTQLKKEFTELWVCPWWLCILLICIIFTAISPYYLNNAYWAGFSWLFISILIIWFIGTFIVGTFFKGISGLSWMKTQHFWNEKKYIRFLIMLTFTFFIWFVDAAWPFSNRE